MPRLFTALSLPEDVRAALTDHMSGLRGARWIAEGDLHITLRFIGDVDGAVADDIAAVLDQIRIDPFEVRLNGFDAFGKDRPKSIHVPMEPSEPLIALQKAHERLIQSVDMKPERRKFSPHVTLARLRGERASEVARWISDQPPFGASFAVDAFHIMSARDSTGGGPYVPVVTYPLGTASEED